MKKRGIYFFAIVLVIVTVSAAVIHFNSRPNISANSVELSFDITTDAVALDELKLRRVSGVRINGKGEQIPVEEQGLSVSEFLTDHGVKEYSKVTVISDDSYSASLTAEEVEQEDNAFFVLEEDELRLIVFGDSNSRRSVSNIKQIEVE